MESTTTMAPRSSPAATATAIAIAAFLLAVSASAQLPPDVLARSSRATLSVTDVATDLESIPPDKRGDFVASRARLGTMVNALLETKTLAAEARANGLDRDPDVQRRVALQVEKALAIARRDQIERDAGAEFDRRRDDYLVRAREIYLVDKAKFTVPEQIRAAHILVLTDKRGRDEALRLAQDIRTRVVTDKADFAALAREVSEDPTAKTNGGDLGWFAAAQMDRAFAAAAFALAKPGDVSQPVLSSFGYHVIRLEGRKPAEVPTFDAVKDAIMAELRRDFIDSKKKEAMARIAADPTLQLNQPAIDALGTTLLAPAKR